MRRTIATIIATLLVVSVPVAAHQQEGTAIYTMPQFPTELTPGDIMVTTLVFNGTAWEVSTGHVIQSLYSAVDPLRECSILPIGPSALARDAYGS